MAETVLELRDVKKVFSDGTEALKGITSTVKKGELVSIIGSSGAGKSTLLRSINRLNDPTGGEILFQGKNILSFKRRDLRQYRRHMGMIFQGYNLVKRSSVIQNVLHGRLGYMNTLSGGFGHFSKEDSFYALEVLSRVGLKDQAFKRADELSGGQQQRVGIARAIAQNPDILLADEPIASLDPNSSWNVMNYLKQISKEDEITTIVNLHQVDFAREFADRIIGVKAGEIVFDGPPAHLTERKTQMIYTT
ncbi:phosphonate transport system ATP-binding protein [Geomicrobium halophilum]|uniref:Phosphonate transport system ATP-binding protein n=1 Tax=Geomicrobium halophilum TaxID=549000 RepID=A0A841PMF8_9BACL|nr:phosphonate ABC transporter ATP-binding protein [Geomicrobium halophilum]MBB6449919.1 phosphonate transport system ATP-binding protein [Geomicrobium halophilum]